MARNPLSSSQELQEALRGLKSGDHLCCIYETDEEHRALLTLFMRQGLDLGEKVVYIVDAREAEDIFRYLREDGLAVEDYRKSGQLKVLSAAESYMRESAFDPDAMISLLEAETDLALAEGYSALRVTGEMTWALRGLPGSERLIEYETKLNEFFPRSRCIAICQYDRRRFEPGLLLGVLMTHPIAVIGTKLFDNFYYIPPEDLLSSDPEAARLTNWMCNLEAWRTVEKALRNREERFRSIYSQSPVGIELYDASGKLIDVNPACLDLFGVADVNQVRGFDLFEDPNVPNEVRERLKDGQPVSYETAFDFELVKQKGLYRTSRSGCCFIDCLIAPLQETPGSPSGFLVHVRDITERKRAEDALKKAYDELERRVEERTEELAKAELKYRTVADLTYDWEYWKSPDWSVLYMSPSCERVTGYAPEEFQKNPMLIREIIIPEDQPIWDEHYRACHESRRPGQVEFRIRDRSGGIVWIEHGCRPVINEKGQFLGTRASNRDVTVRKESQRNLAASEAFLKTILSSMHDHVAVVDRQGKIINVNEAWLQFARENDLRRSSCALPGADYLGTCEYAAAGGNRESQMAADGIRAVLGGVKARFDMEYECSSPEARRWFAMSVTPLLRQEGGAVIAHRNITDRRVAEQQASLQKQNLAEAQRIAHLGSWDWNIMTNELAWSDEVYRIFGLEPQQFGATYDAFLERVHPDDREVVKTAVNRSLADPSLAYSIQHRVVRPDGTTRIVHERGEVTPGVSGKPIGMIGTVHDITEQKAIEAESRQLRARLAHLDRVGTIGVLTAALAHEINQPLAAILSNAQAAVRLLAAAQPDLQEVEDALEDIVSDDRRAAEVIQRLRDMLKREELEQETLDLNTLVLQVAEMMHSEFILRNTLLEKELADTLPIVSGDRVQIQQVLINLLMNALDAVGSQPASARRISVTTQCSSGNEVMATVTDSGPGVAHEKLEAVFDAFYSTKQKGIGVGLALCQTIIQAHGGRLWVENHTGGGAAFSFTLPASAVKTDTKDAQ